MALKTMAVWITKYAQDTQSLSRASRYDKFDAS